MTGKEEEEPVNASSCALPVNASSSCSVTQCEIFSRLEDHSKNVTCTLNHEYRTLDGTSPTATSSGCQSSYMALPAGGWVLSPYDDAARAVTAMYPWGADCLVFADGDSIMHKSSYAIRHGVDYCPCRCGSGMLLQSGNQYAVDGCSGYSRRILIRRRLARTSIGEDLWQIVPVNASSYSFSYELLFGAPPPCLSVSLSVSVSVSVRLSL